MQISTTLQFPAPHYHFSPPLQQWPPSSQHTFRTVNVWKGPLFFAFDPFPLHDAYSPVPKSCFLSTTIPFPNLPFALKLYAIRLLFPPPVLLFFFSGLHWPFLLYHFLDFSFLDFRDSTFRVSVAYCLRLEIGLQITKQTITQNNVFQASIYSPCCWVVAFNSFFCSLLLVLLLRHTISVPFPSPTPFSYCYLPSKTIEVRAFWAPLNLSIPWNRFQLHMQVCFPL